MKRMYITLAVAASLTAMATVQAQQQFGRDSVYAVPGKSTQSTTTTAPTGDAPINRFGRDSVYVTQTPNFHSTPLSADAKSLQQYGRDSVFANGTPNPPAATSGESKIGSTGDGHGG